MTQQPRENNAPPPPDAALSPQVSSLSPQVSSLTPHSSSLSPQVSSLTPHSLPTWHLTIAYDGTAFHGWQIQSKPRTVQGELQKRLAVLFRTPDLRVAGTSRTDAGVHALEQHVSFQAETPGNMDADRLQHVLNRWLPQDIRVQHAEKREDDFSARFSSTGKAYTYCVYTGEKPHPFVARFVWHYPRTLDLEAIQETCGYLTGKQDFTSFAANPKRPIDTHVRHVMRVDAVREGDFLYFSVVGESFLYKMVRSMVGYAVHVGAGRATPADTPAVLAAKDRCAAADSAPAQGLFLARVFFEPDEWRSYTPLLPPFSGTL